MGKFGKVWKKVNIDAPKKLIKSIRGKGNEKKRALTKSQERTLKQGAKEFERGQPYREEAEQAMQSQLRGQDALSQQLQQNFGQEGRAYSPDFYKNAFQNAQLAYEPLQNVAREQFRQQTIPDIVSAYGSGSKMSSSFQQALAEAARSLGTHVSGQIGQFAQQDVLNRQNSLYNTLNQQYAGQQNAAANLSQTGYPGAQLNLSRDKYYVQEAGPTMGQKIIPIAAGATGAYLSGGNPQVAMASYQAGQGASQALQR